MLLIFLLAFCTAVLFYMFCDFVFLHCLLVHREKGCALISHRKETVIAQVELEAHGAKHSFHKKVAYIFAPFAEAICMLESARIASMEGAGGWPRDPGTHIIGGWAGGGARDPGTPDHICIYIYAYRFCNIGLWNWVSRPSSLSPHLSGHLLLAFRFYIETQQQFRMNIWKAFGNMLK